MARNLLRYLARPAGPALERTTFEKFLDLMRPYSVESLVSGFNEFSWKAWRGEFEAMENSLSQSVGPVLAPYALAVGSSDPNAQNADYGVIIDLQFHFLAIDSVPTTLLRQHAEAIAKRVIGTDLAFVIPSLEAARLAATNCILARIHRSQLLPSRSSLDELSKTWWIARRVDADADQIARAERILGMQVPVFVRAASALLAFAVTCTPMGPVFLDRTIDPEFLEKYDVDADTLKLAAYKLATTRTDVQTWIDEVSARFPDGTKQFVPTPLLTTPLLRLDLGSGPPYVCPSLPHFVAAVRDRVREAIATPGRTDVDSAELYGAYLVRYVLAFAQSAALHVIDLDTVEGRTLRRADLLFLDNKRALITEVKRSLATGALSRHLLYPEGIVAVFDHLLGAYRQCQATYARRPWRSLGADVERTAAVILVDEPVGGEGAAFSDLLGAQTSIDLPFEIMSVTEFENAVGVLGVDRLVDLINRKWSEGFRDVPLNVYARNILGFETQRVDGKRLHLESEDRELFFEAGLSTRGFAAEWP